MNYRNLEVPYFSQRENQCIWHERYSKDNKLVQAKPELEGTIIPNGQTDTKAKNSCNITSLAMVLHYFGITNDTPDEMMRKVFNPKTEELNGYTSEQKNIVTDAYSNNDYFELISNMKNFAEQFYNVKAEVYYDKKFTEIRNEILNGYPVIVSCGLLRAYNEESYIPDCKKSACAEVFSKKIKNVKDTEYDDTIQEYKNQLAEKNKLLEDETTSSEEKKLIKKQIEEIQNAKSKLENNYQKKLDYKLNDYRFHGHYIVIRGITYKGVIINDPWGLPELSKVGKADYYSVMNGDNIELEQGEFDKQYFHDGHFWSTLIIREKRWNFVSCNENFLISNINFFENCRNAEMFEFGGYPIKRSNLWHNGIHFSSKIGNEIYPIGPGQLVAARIVNKDPSGNEPANGSCCFVLIKHQIKDDDDNLNDFFVCYMHLKPIENLDELISNGKKTNIAWLYKLIKRTKRVRQIKYGVDDTSFYAENDKNGESEIGKLPDSSIFMIDSINENEKKINFYYEIDDKIDKYWVKYNDNVLTRSDFNDIFKKLLDDLKTGNVVYFNDKDLLTVDSMIEVTNSSPIGFMGKYGGYSDNLKDTLHLEIFSNDILIKNTKDFSVIKKSELQSNISNYSAMCNRKDMIAFFEDKKLYGAFDFQFLNNDGLITKKEMINFYNSTDGAVKFQNYIIQHISEWSDKINWEEALEKAKGVSNNGLMTLIRGCDFEEDIKTYVNKIYNPYKWFNSACITAMNTKSSLFNQGYATFYHPLRFIQWLNENNK